ncbi:hypothetical protein L873DRAFT_1721283 [Choiromyces venosus 120613-1]|uniref:Rsm22-domain-containing protein n=1 Tax=Choiromyces venosus 120613-1 TaxID=1336337 RepID=A0A3N4IXN4_9PEZI|nr:hypothetical protein L873DRAFT_1721283 [Choiromyces venosus 120613-1]
MLATRRTLRYLRLPKQLSPLLNSQFQFCHLHTTFPTRSKDPSAPPPSSPPTLLAPPTIVIKPPIEEYVRQIREQYGNYLPAGLLEENEYKLYERYYGRPTRLLQTGETIVREDNLFPPPETPAVEALYAQVARRLSPHEWAQKEEEDDLDDHFVTGSPRLFHTHPLTSVSRFGTFPSTIALPRKVEGETETLIVDVAPQQLVDSAHNTLGGPHLQFSPIYSHKRSKRALDIPLNPTNPHMSNIDADVYLSAVMPGLYAQCLSSLTELRRRLGSDWVLGGDGDEKGVKNVLDVGSGGAGILAWRSIIEAEEERRRDELEERTDWGAPPAAKEGSGLRAVVVTAPDALRGKASRLLDNTTFITRMPDVNFENLFHTPGVDTEKNKAQPRKLYDLIIASNRLLPIVKRFYRRQIIDQLWSHLNPNGGVLLMIEKGTPMGFEAIAGARSTILKNYLQDVGEAFQSRATTNADGSTSDRTTKGPGAIIAPCTNHEQCPLFIHGATDGTQRKDYCRFSQRFRRPQYLQKIAKRSSNNTEDIEYSYVAFRRGTDHRADTKNKISPTKEDFSTTPVDGGAGTEIEGPYTMAQLRNHTLTLPRIVLAPLKRPGHIIMDVCTPEGMLERWTVPRSLGKVEYRDARKSRWGDLWALGAKTRVRRNIKVGSENNRSLSKLIAIRDPYDGGVRAIVKDKTTAYLKSKKKQAKEDRKVERLERKQEAIEKHAEMIKMHKERKLREKGLRKEGDRQTHAEKVRISRERRRKEQEWDM